MDWLELLNIATRVVMLAIGIKWLVPLFVRGVRFNGSTLCALAFAGGLVVVYYSTALWLSPFLMVTLPGGPAVWLTATVIAFWLITSGYLFLSTGIRPGVVSVTGPGALLVGGFVLLGAAVATNFF